jgi:hypothetical protein
MVRGSTPYFQVIRKPRRIIPTIGSDPDAIRISIRPTKSYRIPGNDLTCGFLVLDLIGSRDALVSLDWD